MRELPRIKAAYDWFFARWQQEAAEAARNGDLSAIDRLEEKRDVLERGIFVMMFGQFETAVDDAFSTAKANRVNNPDWTHRRGWDADSLQGKKVPFETKLSMTLDRRSSSHGKILSTYATRNHCAHGGTTSPVGSIDALEADLYSWRSELKT